MTSRFTIQTTALAGMNVLLRHPLQDNRGSLQRLFCQDELQEVLGTRQIKQINQSVTKLKGTVRGLHFQHAPHGEMKFVQCVRGEVFDVAVDLRHGSPTFLKWHAEILSPDNHKTMVIPEGFAHGFQTLTEDCELLYFHTAIYAPGFEGAFHAQEKRIGINWPLPITELSARDTAHPLMTQDFTGVTP